MTAQRCIRRPGSVWSGCRCERCARLKARTEAMLSLGLIGRAPTRAAWRVLADRVAAGWSPLAIASAAGVPARTLHAQIERYVATGHQGPLHHATARAILTMGTPTEGYLHARATTRRLRALAAVGWPIEEIAAHAGVGAVTLYGLRAARRDTVTVAVHQRVARAYTALAEVPGPSTASVRRALAAGWEPPAAWDEDSIEDPAEPEPVAVDLVAVERAIEGRPVPLTLAEQDEVLRRMNAAQRPDQEIAAVLGLNPMTILRRRQRLGLPGVLPPQVQRARAAA